MATRPIRIPRVGNLAARSPLMRKGGAHVKSKTGIRHQQRKKTKQGVDDWYKNKA